MSDPSFMRDLSQLVYEDLTLLRKANTSVKAPITDLDRFLWMLDNDGPWHAWARKRGFDTLREAIDNSINKKKP